MSVCVSITQRKVIYFTCSFVQVSENVSAIGTKNIPFEIPMTKMVKLHIQHRQTIGDKMGNYKYGIRKGMPGKRLIRYINNDNGACSNRGLKCHISYTVKQQKPLSRRFV